MTNIANWKITIFLMGKSTISMAIFDSKLLVYQRVKKQAGKLQHLMDGVIREWRAQGATWFLVGMQPGGHGKSFPYPLVN